MDLLIDNEEWYISKTRLAADLMRDNILYVSLAEDGELVCFDLDTRRHEVYMSRPTGYPNAYCWAGMDFEFCRSYSEDTI